MNTKNNIDNKNITPNETQKNSLNMLTQINQTYQAFMTFLQSHRVDEKQKAIINLQKSSIYHNFETNKEKQSLNNENAQICFLQFFSKCVEKELCNENLDDATKIDLENKKKNLEIEKYKIYQKPIVNIDLQFNPALLNDNYSFLTKLSQRVSPEGKKSMEKKAIELCLSVNKMLADKKIDEKKIGVSCLKEATNTLGQAVKLFEKSGDIKLTNICKKECHRFASALLNKQAEIADANFEIGKRYFGLGEYKDSASYLKKAYKFYVEMNWLYDATEIKKYYDECKTMLFSNLSENSSIKLIKPKAQRHSLSFSNQSDCGEAYDNYSKGVACYNAGEYRAAIDFFNDAIDGYRDKYRTNDAHSCLDWRDSCYEALGDEKVAKGNEYYDNNEFDEARDLFYSALDLYKNVYDDYEKMRLVERCQKEIEFCNKAEKAYERYDKAIELYNYGNETSDYERGYDYLNDSLEEFERAKELFAICGKRRDEEKCRDDIDYCNSSIQNAKHNIAVELVDKAEFAWDDHDDEAKRLYQKAREWDPEVLDDWSFLDYEY